ncbi:U32 family peptidase [Candidatus Dependentiae bacterium]|nr:U32 family peptidase [Candidatus Dependentiae bacterium]
MKNIPEINAPAGNLEKLKFAIEYGADAVYISGKNFGLRKFAGNFSNEEIINAVKYSHSRHTKIYLTLNIFGNNSDFGQLGEYIDFLSENKIDGVIISDPGIFYYVRKKHNELPVFISTQANTLNSYSVHFWKELGARRIILGRELSLDDIKKIKEEVEEIELELFVHGALCISYSGRCFLSKYMTGRDANRGECTHPCRWKYYIMEETRPGEYYKIEEEESGAYIFNSKDLCCISILDEICSSGISCLKIEGRMKSVYYTAITTAVYKNAVKTLYKNENEFRTKLNFYIEELKKISNRHYTTGFYQGKIPEADSYNYSDSSYHRNYDFIGIVNGFDELSGLYEIEIRGKLFKNDFIEIVNKNLDLYALHVEELYDKTGMPADYINPNQNCKIKSNILLNKFDIVRRKKND